MKIDVIMKRGDVLPPITARILQANGEAVDLTAATVAFSMRGIGQDRTPVIDAESVTVLAPASAGRVRFNWPEGSTDAPGVYEGEFDVTLYGEPFLGSDSEVRHHSDYRRH